MKAILFALTACSFAALMKAGYVVVQAAWARSKMYRFTEQQWEEFANRCGTTLKGGKS